MNNKDKKLIDKYGGAEQLEKYILEISKVLGDVPIDAMKTVIENKDKELEKKDKMINVMAELMAHKIGTRTHICQHMNCDKKIAKECKSCVIEWAEQEVK